MSITLKNVKEINDLLFEYASGIENIPPKYTEPVAFRVPEYGEYYLTSPYGTSVIHTNGTANSMPTSKRLIVELKPVRYQFICDDTKLRYPKIGDWVLSRVNGMFIKVNDITTAIWTESVIFRREEIPYETKEK